MGGSIFQHLGIILETLGKIRGKKRAIMKSVETAHTQR